MLLRCDERIGAVGRSGAASQIACLNCHPRAVGSGNGLQERNVSHETPWRSQCRHLFGHSSTGRVSGLRVCCQVSGKWLIVSIQNNNVRVDSDVVPHHVSWPEWNPVGAQLVLHISPRPENSPGTASSKSLGRCLAAQASAWLGTGRAF